MVCFTCSASCGNPYPTLRIGVLYNIAYQMCCGQYGQRELHLTAVHIWDGRRYVIRSIRSEVVDSRC